MSGAYMTGIGKSYSQLHAVAYVPEHFKRIHNNVRIRTIAVGAELGIPVGTRVGNDVGAGLGMVVGAEDGVLVGVVVGALVGRLVGGFGCEIASHDEEV